MRTSKKQVNAINPIDINYLSLCKIKGLEDISSATYMLDEVTIMIPNSINIDRGAIIKIVFCYNHYNVTFK